VYVCGVLSDVVYDWPQATIPVCGTVSPKVACVWMKHGWVGSTMKWNTSLEVSTTKRIVVGGCRLHY